MGLKYHFHYGCRKETTAKIQYILSMTAICCTFLCFYFLKFIIYLFVYFWLCRVLAAAHRVFVAGPLVVVHGLSLSSCGATAPGRVGSVVCGVQAPAEARELSSCGTWA